MEWLEARVLETCRVSPPPGSVTPSSIILPLTYLDVFCVGFRPVKCLFLYAFPCSTADFLDTHVPNLKRSLAVALERFYPLAGVLVHGEAGYGISFAEGDSIPLTIAESRDDFVDLVGNHEKEDRRFLDLVAELPPAEDGEGESLLAVKITVFPGRGIGVGLTAHHAAVDGFSATRFVEAWASFARMADEESTSVWRLPLIVGRGPDQQERLLEKVTRMKKALDSAISDGAARINRTRLNTSDEAMARATFVLTLADLDGLRKWACEKTGFTCSDFVVAIALVWVCLMKENGTVVAASSSSTTTQEKEETILEDSDGYVFFSDMRGRAGRASGVFPHNYFVRELHRTVSGEAEPERAGGEAGVAKAAVAIRDEIQRLKSASEPMEKDFAPDVRDLNTLQSVAMSPRLGLYKVDFGWGKPRKVEFLSTERMCGIFLAEHEAADHGGIEVGVLLPFTKMRRFAIIFHRQLETCTVQSSIPINA